MSKLLLSVIVSPHHDLGLTILADILCRLLYGFLQDGLVHIYCQKKLETAPSIQGISSSSNTPEKLCSAFLEKLIRENLCLTLLFVSQWQLSCLILGRRICRYKLWEFYGLTFMWFDICACSTFLDLNSLAFIYFFSTSTIYNLTA